MTYLHGSSHPELAAKACTALWAAAALGTDGQLKRAIRRKIDGRQKQ